MCQSCPRERLKNDVYQLLPLCVSIPSSFFVTRVCENLIFLKVLIVQVSVANTTIEISKENFYRLGKVLLPPEPEVLARSVFHMDIQSKRLEEEYEIGRL
jgi:hypothetical protein